jgi:YHS domain-containing protein
MKTQLMWVASLLLAVVIVAGCESKEKPAAGAKSMDHPTAKKSDHPCGTKSADHPCGTKPAATSAQTTCPVMGGKIVKSVYGDHMGKRVYFCCAGCIGTFNKDPMKYIKQLEDKGVVLEKTPS